ncbi:MAG: TetR/AcrR family transcriptional regulator [Parvibaculaceae bacterium]|nr:TetR/AcrR family transcriptional regulator [Parvibaculaceae bacterium]
MARKKPAGVEDRIIDATLALVQEQSWRDLTLGHIAEAAGLSLAETVGVFPSKAAILDGFSRRIDKETLKLAAEEDFTGASPRDILFDIIMLGFDAMTPYRSALKALTKDVVQEPLSALSLLSPTFRSLSLMLEAAGIDSSGLKGMLRVRGLAVAWASAFRVWLTDGEDQAKTMAELDKRLRQGENIIRALRQRRENRRARRQNHQEDAAE